MTCVTAGRLCGRVRKKSGIRISTSIISPAIAGSGDGGSIVSKLTHLDELGQARMVEVGGKEFTRREAVARGEVAMRKETLDMILEGRVSKGEGFGYPVMIGCSGSQR